MSPLGLPGKDQWLQLAVAQGLLTEAEVQAAISTAQAKQADPAMALIREQRVTPVQVATLKAEAVGAAFIDVSTYQVDPAALRLVPESVARKHRVLPLYRIDNALTVAVADPWDPVAIDAVRVYTKLPIIQLAVTMPDALQKAIDHLYGLQAMDEVSKPPAGQPGETAGEPSPVPVDMVDESSVIKLVDALLHEAHDMRASDIHLEPEADQVRVRVRIDGVLHEMKTFPIGLHEPLCSRIKVLAKLDIAEHRLPQDGHMLMPSDGGRIDLRISTFPTITGENVVIRLLDQSVASLQLKDLELSEAVLQQFHHLIARPFGLVLVTGPTGSGKTTTLYAALNQINSVTKNIMTIEDPVEYHVSLIRQTQTHVKAGMTFATGMRSILRQDPDVILVGEIRDRETADIAVQAALTGHLVMSTLHTNDAVGAVARLIEMGVEPFLLAATLLGVVGQRLIRRICQECAEGSRPSPEMQRRYPELKAIYRGRGCRRCRQTGYSGRVGVFELFLVDECTGSQIAARTPADRLRGLALERGMQTMRMDGMRKVRQRLSTLEELDRIVPPDLSA
jgi:type IV pilus assembly protein PilB